MSQPHFFEDLCFSTGLNIHSRPSLPGLGQVRLWRLDATERSARLERLQQKLLEAETELREAEKDMEEPQPNMELDRSIIINYQSSIRMITHSNPFCFLAPLFFFPLCFVSLKTCRCGSGENLDLERCGGWSDLLVGLGWAN